MCQAEAAAAAPLALGGAASTQEGGLGLGLGRGGEREGLCFRSRFTGERRRGDGVRDLRLGRKDAKPRY